jgi:septation ring formation regulator EzrA
MSSNFSSLADKVRQSADRAAQEMAQAAEVEAELQELAQQWQNQWYAYRDEPEVSREIRSLLDGIESELNYIRREYKRKVTRYSQVMQSLKDLHRKVRFYQVALDADRALDVAGNIRRNR